MEIWEIIVLIYFFLGYYGFLICLMYKYRKTKVNISNETIKLNENYECAICLENIREYENIYKLSCRHKYHIDCLNRWVKEKSNCPLCLNEICLV
tara:strand:+ start:1213 stop:1497 length:285 start_codon:yes stop_codon:yes gene_type:complete